LENCFRMLKIGGILILGVPTSIAETTVEHSPLFDDWEVICSKWGDLLIGKVGDSFEFFENVVFRGGPGTMLEMHQFSGAVLIATISGAGFFHVFIHEQAVANCGFWWPYYHETISQSSQKSNIIVCFKSGS
jgi:hypothetical protein